MASSAAGSNVASGGAGSSDFWSIIGTIGTAVGNVAQALPVWASQTRQTQTGSQISQPNYIGTVPQLTSAQQVGPFGLTQTQLLIGGVLVAGIVLILVLRK